MRAPSVPVHPRRARHAAAAAAGLLLLAAVAGAAWRGRAPATVVGEVARAAPARAFAARTSLAPSYRPCPAVPAPDGGTVPVSGCGTGAGAPPALAALADAGASTDPDTLRASALSALVWWDGEEASLDAAVERLTRALRLSARPVPVLVDLSGAHLVRAERTQNPRDLLQGLEYALEALEAAPRDRAARFNAALALDALGLDDRAALAWDAYLAVDRRSRWAAEARERRAALLRRPPPPVPPTPASSAAEVRAFAAAHPQEARLLGMNELLGRWGERVEAGDTAGARAFLRLAEGLGAALEARGGDATLADLVRAIGAAAADSAATRRLAAAHRDYAEGQVAYVSFDHEIAREAFTRAAADGIASPVLVRSARLFRAGLLVYMKESAAADSALHALHAEMDTARHPALAARAGWMYGTLLLRTGRPTESRTALARAGRLFEFAGEGEHTGTMWAIEGEAAYQQRDTTAAYPALHRGLRRLRSYRVSPRLYNALFVLAYAAQMDGMPRAATAVHEENIALSIRLGSPLREIDSRLARARFHAVAGLPGDGAADLARATALLDSIPADARLHMASQLQYSRAIRADARATAQLDSVVAYFTRTGESIWLLPVLLRRAELRLAAGDLDRGTADLEEATARVRSLSDDQEGIELRAAVVEGARSRFDRLVMLHLDRGEPAAALAALERGRASFAPADSTAPRGRPRAPAGHVAVEYALIGDTLLAWTVRGERVEVTRRRVDRAALLRTIERVGAALEAPGRAAAAEPELARLHDLLVRPVRGRLGPAGTPLVILADGEVAAVPFAALTDRETGRRLLEDHPLRFAPTLADAAREVPREGGAARPALLIADPAFDRARHPTLDPLAGARAEVAALRAVYPDHQVLDGPRATPAALAREAARADVVHYAGHAVFDDARPERSYLVLAGGRMDAGAANALRLDGVRVVVLSACRTLRARGGRTGGFAGLAGALLGAGAGGVVGSAWEVDDRLAAPLMLEFHRAYRRTGDAAAALREAQLRMLRSPDPALRSPAAWAGFRYVGGGAG